MKTLGELMFNLKDDPEKERLRHKTLAEARVWEEADPPVSRSRRSAPAAGGDDPLAGRLLSALPQLNSAQRRMLETLLDSWEH